MTHIKKDSVELPFCIHQIVELKDNPKIIARIIQYRIVRDCGLKLIAGLNFSLDSKDDTVDFEIDAIELEEKFQKKHDILLIPGKLKASKELLGEYLNVIQEQQNLEENGRACSSLKRILK